MSNVQFGTNTPALRKQRLYYRESSVIYAGMPVCYDFDTTTNVLGWDNDASQARGTTTDEGYQNEGKFLRVENPSDDNKQWFAGVVVDGGYCGKTGPKWVDVYEPNGAIVPVRAGVECVVGRTVLAIISNTQYLGHPLSAAQARAVAIAEETNAGLDTTPGLILAKLDPSLFLYQDSTGDTLYIGVGGTAAAASQCLNYVNVETAHTGGYTSAMVHKLTVSGTLAATGGAASIIGYMKISGSITAATSYTRSILGQLELTGTINGSNAHLCGVMAQVHGTPTFTACSKVAGLMVDLSLGVNPSAGTYNGIMISNNGANQTEVDNAIEIYGNYGINTLFSFQSCDGITGNFIANLGTGANKVITSGTAGTTYKVKCKYGSATAYLILYTDPTEASN